MRAILGFYPGTKSNVALYPGDKSNTLCPLLSLPEDEFTTEGGWPGVDRGLVLWDTIGRYHDSPVLLIVLMTVDA